MSPRFQPIETTDEVAAALLDLRVVVRRHQSAVEGDGEPEVVWRIPRAARRRPVLSSAGATR